jgi:hypothetical protein
VHWMWTWFDPEGPRSAAEVAASFVDTFLGGVLTDPGAARALGDPDGTVARVVAEAVAAGRAPSLDGDLGHTAG